MKQILQSAKSGKLELVDVPAPAVAPGQVFVRNAFSVMSPGTEKMAMDFARKSLLGKARSRPDLVKQVTRKLMQEGPLPTYRTVMNRLDAPQPLGYACAGIVEAVGEGVMSVSPGDRIACAGAGYANHAELVVVPENLTAHVPETLGLEEAAFATLGAIALQGVRVAEPTLGEVVAVVGLGLIGQLTVQLLLANGCRVYGLDLDPKRVEEAKAQGMEFGGAPGDDHDRLLSALTGGHGVDLTIVTAASDSSAPVALAAELCRHKGRVVCVGATAMDLDRRTFYEKELDLRMSMSYGPGRYDYRYEEGGVDYPVAYVRWTEQRNLQAFLDLAARGAVDPSRMDTEVVDFELAPEAYEALASGERRSLAVVFRYGDEPDRRKTHGEALPAKRSASGRMRVGFIGAGNYAKGMLLPALRSAGDAEPQHVVTATGPSAHNVAERFGFARYGTDPDEVFSADDIDAVFVTTRHDSHASLATAALRAGKAVWLEKPAALSEAELAELEAAAGATDAPLMVGFNRRFSEHAKTAREWLGRRIGPLAMHYTVAAGSAPAGTWIMDEITGGGRILGEACHFVDLCDYMVGSTPTWVVARALSEDASRDDSMVATLGYADGSTATIHYLALASAELPKERWEVHADGRSAICDNFRVTSMPGRKPLRTLNQDKGQATAIADFGRCVREGGPSPMRLVEISGATRTTFAMVESSRTGAPVVLPRPGAESS
ncbi:MAG: bi-domain-containing oxidoreductase [Myxococcota bacterium]